VESENQNRAVQNIPIMENFYLLQTRGQIAEETKLARDGHFVKNLVDIHHKRIIFPDCLGFLMVRALQKFISSKKWKEN
jgi:hypothetical protein